jgi:hypothetical protein
MILICEIAEDVYLRGSGSVEKNTIAPDVFTGPHIEILLCLPLDFTITYQLCGRGEAEIRVTISAVLRRDLEQV